MGSPGKNGRYGRYQRKFSSKYTLYDGPDALIANKLL
jgi:hypothetical protein